MGVTIHFYGQLNSPAAFDEVIYLGREWAARRNLPIITLDSDLKELIRIKNGKVWEYLGPIRGIEFLPHESSDPIMLEFDKHFYLGQFCKTQFAGIPTHIEIIQFLKEIEPYFDKLNVVDEGGFWESSDISLLEERFEKNNQTLQLMIKENAKFKGPLRLGNRMIDLMT